MSYLRPGSVLALSAGLLLILGLAARSGDYDIVAMMRKIHQATTEIGNVNASILTSLGTVRQEFEQVDVVKERLVVMEGLVDQQVKELEQLAAQTGRQAEVSREMQRLTAKLRAPVDGLARSAAQEADLLEGMSQRTADLAVSLQAISTINRAMAEKLWRAEELSALVLSRMP